MKKISELLEGECLKLNGLIILCIKPGVFLYLMAGQTIKRTEEILEDLELPLATEQELSDTLDKVDHKNDWFSVLNADLITNNFIEKNPVFKY